MLHVSTYDKNEDINEKWVQKEWMKSMLISMVLPITPKIGEHIEISFANTIQGFSTDHKYYFGYVRDIRHTITGTTQQIDIFIHPFANVYYKWAEMKKEYESSERWREERKRENEEDRRKTLRIRNLKTNRNRS